MSITDELREFIETHLYLGATALGGWKEAAFAIADRIDAEAEDNERFRREAEPFCDRLREASDERADVTLFGIDYTALPMDADGEYIRIGDQMDSKVDYLFDGRPFDVRALVLLEDGWEVADGRFGNRYEPNSLRHHHEPTVEDVLREFAVEVCGEPALTIRSGVVEEYAAKLRLAGEDE